MIRIKDITDGTSVTYMVGEKFVATELYLLGVDASDNEWIFVGYDNDTYRTATGLVDQNGTSTIISNCVQDRHSDPGNGIADGKHDENGGNRWGSPHNNTFNMVYCDGSVHAVPYGIDLKVHKNLANRADGKDVKTDF